MKIISSRGKKQATPAGAQAAHPVAFINQYLSVDNKLGPVKIILNAPQERLVNALHSHSNVISKMPRLAGQTTALLSYAAWKCMFTPGKTIAFATPNNMMANMALEALRAIVMSAPTASRPAVTNMRLDVSFANGSSVKVAPAEAIAKAILVTGFRYDDIFISDMAALTYQVQQLIFSTAASSLSTTSQLVVSSTPRRAGDVFHDLWVRAQAGNQFFPVDASWHEYMQPSSYLRWVQSLSADMVKSELDAEFVS